MIPSFISMDTITLHPTDKAPFVFKGKLLFQYNEDFDTQITLYRADGDIATADYVLCVKRDSNTVVSVFLPCEEKGLTPVTDNIWECSNCGILTRDEVKQVVCDGCCIEACRQCDSEAHPTTLDRIVDGESINRNRKCLFHLARVPVSEGSYQTCYGVFQKEVSSKEELVRSKDKGELMGKFQDRYEAMDKIHELAKLYGEFAIFE